MKSHIRIRLLTIAAALLLLAVHAGIAQPTCCNSVTINNTTTCTFTVHAVINGIASVTWTINPGANVFPFSQCFSVALDITDMCGNVVPFPGTAGPCIDVPVAATCCVNLCQTAICEWTASPGTCDPC